MIRVAVTIVAGLACSLALGSLLGRWLHNVNMRHLSPRHYLDPDLSAYCARPCCVCGDILCGGDRDY